mmetsp:Transcript_10795/g.23515  ORF Transcript_10795/g.23515 Transcript_10795/m.23515 type:complete len:380 (-) Transcript_10795:678-1817(-)
MHLKAVKILRRICGILQGQQLVAGRSPLDRGGDTGVLQHVNSPGGSIEGNLSGAAGDRFAGITDLHETRSLECGRGHAIIRHLWSNGVNLLLRKLRQPVSLGQGTQCVVEAPAALLPPRPLEQIVLGAVPPCGPGNLEISIRPIRQILQRLRIPPPGVLAILNSQPGEIQVRRIPRVPFLQIPRDRPIQSTGLGRLLGVAGHPVNPGVSHLLGDHRQLLPETTLIHSVQPFIKGGSHDLSPRKLLLNLEKCGDVVQGAAWPLVVPHPVGDQHLVPPWDHHGVREIVPSVPMGVPHGQHLLRGHRVLPPEDSGDLRVHGGSVNPNGHHIHPVGLQHRNHTAGNPGDVALGQGPLGWQAEGIVQGLGGLQPLVQHDGGGVL